MDETKQEVKEDSLIEKAKLQADRIEEANKVTLELLDRQEKMMVREIIAGKTEAGTETVQKTDEEKSIDAARDMLKGTGYDEKLFPKENK